MIQRTTYRHIHFDRTKNWTAGCMHTGHRQECNHTTSCFMLCSSCIVLECDYVPHKRSQHQQLLATCDVHAQLRTSCTSSSSTASSCSLMHLCRHTPQAASWLPATASSPSHSLNARQSSSMRDTTSKDAAREHPQLHSAKR